MAKIRNYCPYNAAIECDDTGLVGCDGCGWRKGTRRKVNVKRGEPHSVFGNLPCKECTVNNTSITRGVDGLILKCAVSSCKAWDTWFRDVWPIVTGRIKEETDA